MTYNTNKWEKRNVSDESRVLDSVELYKSMGFEVKVEDFSTDHYQTVCNECMVESPERFKVIYTRRIEDFNDELFEEFD